MKVRNTVFLSLVVGCALFMVPAAAAGFLNNPDRVTWNNSGVWLILKDGRADHVTAKAAGEDGWSFTMPLNRFISWEEDRFKHNGCERENWEGLFPHSFRTLVCNYMTWDIHMRMGDLNDTFVANDLTAKLFLYGEDGSDYLRSSSGKDSLSGGSGNDVLRSGAGVDSLLGEGDNDVLDGGDGADILNCGDGSDTVQYQGRTAALTVTLDDLANDGATGENDKIESSCENVEVWNGADRVTGSSGPNRIEARDGNDTLKGGAGSDRLYGGAGKDTLNGDAGNDYLSGEAGDDTISGGSGTDTVYGGDGSDTINVKDGVRDVVYCGGGAYDAVVYDAGIDEIDIGTCERRN